MKIHLGVKQDFVPARRVHTALVVRNLDALIARLRDSGVKIVDDQPLAGWLRIYISDPFGNRIELMERA